MSQFTCTVLSISVIKLINTFQGELMRMMKKFMLFTLIVAIIVSILSGCSEKKQDISANTDTPVQKSSAKKDSLFISFSSATSLSPDYNDGTVTYTVNLRIFEAPIFKDLKNIPALATEWKLADQEISLKLVGTGRYKLTEHVKKDHISIESNRDYRGGVKT